MANIRPLSTALAKKAREELNEDPDRLQEEIEELRSWILKQPHLRARTTDQYLLGFLRGCKHSLERTKEKFDKFYSLLGALPELIVNRDVDDSTMREVLRLGVGLPLPLTDGEDGSRINFVRVAAYDPKKFNFTDVVKLGTMIADIFFIDDDNTVIAGQVNIIDLANITAQHIFQLDLTFIKKLIVFTEQAAPIRQKGIHVINTTPAFQAIFNAARNFMSEKSRNRVFAHGSNLESLYEYVPQRLLPAEYGGTNGTIKDITDYWEKKFPTFRDYFKEQYFHGSDEKLRVGQRIDLDGIFGINELNNPLLLRPCKMISFCDPYVYLTIARKQ